jgi:hypothetical protein
VGVEDGVGVGLPIALGVGVAIGCGVGIATTIGLGLDCDDPDGAEVDGMPAHAARMTPRRRDAALRFAFV